MTWYCYQFEVNSIQRWVFGSGKLRAIVGGSQLVSGITEELLDHTLDALSQAHDDQIQFARKAGGVFIALAENPEALNSLRKVWPLMVARYAPGLSFSTGFGHADTVGKAITKARENISAGGNLPRPELPAATPVMERSRRTGNPAISTSRQEIIDFITDVQYKAEERAQHGGGRGGIGAKLADKLALDGKVWPRDMEPAKDDDKHNFPFRRDDQGNVTNRYVAMVHADGNGLGQLLQGLQFDNGKDGIEQRRRFSGALEDATFAACLTACKDVLVPELGENGLLPARPILLGGDDLSFIVRADLALHFTQVFLQSFEAETAKRLAEIPGVPAGGLTACAGIAYLRSNQPFYMGMELAESLCGHAKKQVRKAVGENMISALCQHRCTDSLISDWDALLDDSLTLPAREADDQRYRLTMEAWSLHRSANDKLPALENLQKLFAYLNQASLSRGPARKLVGMIGQHPSLIAQKYARWLEMLDKTQATGRGAGHFKHLLSLSGFGVPDDRAPFIRPREPALDRDGKAICPTPLAEALALNAMGAIAWEIASTSEEDAE